MVQKLKIYITVADLILETVQFQSDRARLTSRSRHYTTLQITAGP